MDSSLAEFKKEAEELQQRITTQEELRHKKAAAHDLAKKKVADLAGELAAMPPATETPAFAQEELDCLTDILRLVDGSQVEQVCRDHSIDPTLTVGRTTSLLGKVRAHLTKAPPAAPATPSSQRGRGYISPC